MGPYDMSRPGLRRAEKFDNNVEVGSAKKDRVGLNNLVTNLCIKQGNVSSYGT